MKKIVESKVKKILVISLTNLGDIVVTFPVIDILRRDFPLADLGVMIGPKGKSLLIDNPKIEHLYIYDKHMSLGNKWRWLNQLRKERFDFIVDLRHTVFPLLLRPRYATSLIRRRIPGEHMRDQHLRCLYGVHPADISKERYAFFPSPQDVQAVDDFLYRHLQREDRIAVFAPGAADHRKRWTENGFAMVGDYLAQECGLKIVLVGTEQESGMMNRIMARMHMTALDACGVLSLAQTGVLLSRAAICVVNDSGVMHLASYLGTPTVALYGPTNPVLSGPWGDWSGFIQHNKDCMACREKNELAEHTCMEAIDPQEVCAMAQRLLNPTF
ncbi:MAG TPA: glycosyltransferase family 9 protein [Candidatus Bathyarchaeia archaeon]|nr:glycosyltransferase family 9 protein [Candidatus Bathyarchaeia archaeon]